MTAAGADTDRPVVTRTRVVALAVAVILAVLVAVLATRPPAQVNQANSPLLGQPAPSIRAPGIGGEPVDLQAMRGQYVLVNFFASWCGPCHTEQPDLVALSATVHVIGVVFQDSSTSALQFLRQGGASWPAVADPQGALALEWGVRGPPESYLVSPDGNVVAKVLGPVTRAQISYLHGVMNQVARTGQ